MARGALGAAGVRCVWAGAGLQRAATGAGAYCVASHTACLYKFILFVIGICIRWIKVQGMVWILEDGSCVDLLRGRHDRARMGALTCL